MATLIPDKLSAHTSPAVAKLFRTLRKLPDSYTVWYSFQARRPHFLVLSPDQRAFLIHVADTSEELAQSAIQMELLETSTLTSPDSLAEDELNTLSTFSLPHDTPVRRLLVFPNASQNTLDQVVLQRTKNTDVQFLGLQQSSPEHFLTTLETLASEPLPEPALYTLRAAFTPESVIPSSHRPTLIEREKSSSSSPAFLDLHQEELFKQDLLAPPAETDVSATSRLITGPAGSGKSLVLLHRAILTANLHQGARLLVLTHNRPISHQLKERFHQLAPKNTSVHWRTFFSWAASLLHIDREVIGDHKVRQRIASLHARTPELSHLQPDFLTDEVNYLRDLGINTLDDYLTLERTGRLSALQAKSRELVWQLLTNYREELEKDNRLDWHEVALRFYQESSNNPGLFAPGYDFIFIDEAQFFAKIWFTPVLAALKDSGQLFLSADHTQGFLKRRQSWRDLGINIVGRSHRLARVYRSTRQIAESARHFFKSRQPSTQEKDLAEAPDLLPPGDAEKLPNGENIHLFDIASSAQAHREAADLVTRQLERSPHLRGHILILEADSSRVYTLSENLQKHLGPNTVHNLKDRTTPASAPLCLTSSLHAATGLEATSVILLGLDSLLEKEDNPTLTDEERTELRSTHTRLIYVALTRAIARLCIVTNDKPRWQHLLGLSSPKPKPTPATL